MAVLCIFHAYLSIHPTDLFIRNPNAPYLFAVFFIVLWWISTAFSKIEFRFPPMWSRFQCAAISPSTRVTRPARSQPVTMPPVHRYPVSRPLSVRPGRPPPV